MAIYSYFFNAVVTDNVPDRVYNAEDVTSYLKDFVCNGVFPIPANQLKVRAGTDMQVIVGSGSGWIDGHKITNTADYPLTISTADLLLDRKDAVVFYVDTTTRSMGIEVKTGTPAYRPSAPELIRTASRYEMYLATVLVKKQVTEITDADITDTRGDSNKCGFVAGLITQMDTTDLFLQWEALFREWMLGVESQFNDFKHFKKLEGIAITPDNFTSELNVSAYVPQYAFAYDILEVYINGIHLTGDEYTLINDVASFATPIHKAGTVVDFVVYHMVDPD